MALIRRKFNQESAEREKRIFGDLREKAKLLKEQARRLRDDPDYLESLLTSGSLEVSEEPSVAMVDPEREPSP